MQYVLHACTSQHDVRPLNDDPSTSLSTTPSAWKLVNSTLGTARHGVLWVLFCIINYPFYSVL